MELKIDEWKDFYVDDIFDLVPAKGENSTDLIDGVDIPYIAAKYEDNGIKQMCMIEGYENWVSKGNCIVFICLGEGSAGYTNYIPCDFIGMSGKIMIGYLKTKYGRLDEKIGLFLSTVLNLNRPRYSFGRSWTGDRLKKTIVKLPVANDQPDFNFMRNYISSLPHSSIDSSIVDNNMVDLNVDNWKEYKIRELFTVERGNVGNLEEIAEGTTPVVSAFGESQGIDYYLDVDPSYINCITVSFNGSGTGYAAYHSYRFAANSDCGVLIPKFKINSYIGIFISTVIMQNKYRFDYGRKLSKERVEKMIIKLPSLNGKPDFKYMENYIKSLKYSDLMQ